MGTKLALPSPQSLGTSQPDAWGEELALALGNGHTDPSGAPSCPVFLCFPLGALHKQQERSMRLFFKLAF